MGEDEDEIDNEDVDEGEDDYSHRAVPGNERNVCSPERYGSIGTESVVEPCLERPFMLLAAWLLPRIPCAILEYNPIRTCFMGLEGDEVQASGTQR